MNILHDFLSDECGSQVIEMSLIVLLISLPIVSAAGIAADALQQLFTTLGAMMTAVAAAL